MSKLGGSIGSWKERIAKEIWVRGLCWRSLLLKVTFVSMCKKILEISCWDPTSKGLTTLQVKSSEGWKQSNTIVGKNTKDNRFMDISEFVNPEWSLAKYWFSFFCYFIFWTLAMPGLRSNVHSSCPSLIIPRQSTHDISGPPYLPGTRPFQRMSLCHQNKYLSWA